MDPLAVFCCMIYRETSTVWVPEVSDLYCRVHCEQSLKFSQRHCMRTWELTLTCLNALALLLYDSIVASFLVTLTMNFLTERVPQYSAKSWYSYRVRLSDNYRQCAGSSALWKLWWHPPHHLLSNWQSSKVFQGNERMALELVVIGSVCYLTSLTHIACHKLRRSFLVKIVYSCHVAEALLKALEVSALKVCLIFCCGRDGGCLGWRARCRTDDRVGKWVGCYLRARLWGLSSRWATGVVTSVGCDIRPFPQGLWVARWLLMYPVLEKKTYTNNWLDKV